MKQVLAERLLAKVMDWTDTEVTQELTPLLLLAEAKYDHYHQFGPGMRFIERLGRWLSQLPKEDRANAFCIVRDHLIFVSNAEMHTIIDMAYPECILPVQRQLAARQSGIAEHKIIQIEQSDAFRSLVAKTLYIGLSDGSQIGVLRRLNPKAINHESTLLTYTLDEEKANEVLRHIPKSPIATSLEEADAKFEIAVLVDDFTASGTSFIRKEPDGTFKGKLAKVLRSMQEDGTLSKLVNLSSVQILVLFYVSTKYAITKIREDLKDFCDYENIVINIHVVAVHEIDEEVVGVAASNAAIDDLLARRFVHISDRVMDNSYRKGKCNMPYRGFNEGDLSLILFHNSPNNSLPILWFESEDHLALFPRTARHGHK